MSGSLRIIPSAEFFRTLHGNLACYSNLSHRPVALSTCAKMLVQKVDLRESSTVASSEYVRSKFTENILLPTESRTRDFRITQEEPYLCFGHMYKND